jgi:dTDP-glucose 4,6-dehydratase
VRKGISKIVVTGAAGFIGSAFVRRLCKDAYNKIVAVDKLTYAGDLKRLGGLNRRIKFHKADICDRRGIGLIFEKECPEVLINFAAETHVDRSIQDATVFLDTNISGTKVLLDNAIKYNVKRLLHLSTDEVYGEIEKGKFVESSSLKPNSPYSASKAAADLLINSYIRTYSLPAIIVRPCNNYGPWQYPEKLIPLAILKIIRNEKIPVYADGKNVREWLYVDDCAQGIISILQKGKCGQVYNLGSNEERRNINVVKQILNILNANQNMIQFVKDRAGHDKRYRLNSGKVYNEIGWRPRFSFETGLKATALWCLRNKGWLLSKWENIAPLYK